MIQEENLFILKTIWKYRHFIGAVIRYEFQTQYTKSILGSLWVIMNPLYMCIIYTTIFSYIVDIDSTKFSYTLYVATGLLAWNFFTDIVNRSQVIYINYGNIIKQQNCPLFCLPLVVLALASMDFSISFGLFTVYLITTHTFPSWCYLGLIPVLLLQAIYAIGLGTILGLLNIFFRDVGRATTIFLQVGFWLTPAVYLIEKLPNSVQYGLKLNPLTAIMAAYQTIIVHQEWPHWSTLWFPLFITLLVNSLALKFYHQHIADLLDEF